MFPLGLLTPGERAEIVTVKGNSGTCHEENGKCDCRVEDIGLRVGKTVEMLSNGGGGPLLLKVDESRIAIGRGMAMKILVRKPC